jgi:saccharopine dehydrogenase-like protein
MRIFVLGTGATGSLLAQLLERQGHRVTCGDRDPDRARRFLGKRSTIPVVAVNARNLWGIVRAARGSQLLVNASAAVFNEIAMRAALRLRAHYIDLATHLVSHPFRPEQLRYDRKFQQKGRAAVFAAGASPGLTNLLAARAAELIDSVESIHLRLYESTESDDPVSQWSAEVSFDEAVSRPPVVRDGHFKFGKRFGEPETFRFPRPIGETRVVLAAQDEVCIVPHTLKLQEMDAKIGGNEIDRMRRWYRQGKLSRSRGISASRFPKTISPRAVARLIRRKVLHNARFAAALVIRGVKNDQPIEIRWDAGFPTLYQLRVRGLHSTPIAFATASIAALFVKYFPREWPGVHAPGDLPSEIRQAILNDARARGFKLVMKTTRLKAAEDDEEL